MKINKVILESEDTSIVALDLTQDSAKIEDVATSKTFHLANGEIETGILIPPSNIEYYKFQDLDRICVEGGVLATDEEYEAAEIQLQQIYKEILEGINE